MPRSIVSRAASVGRRASLAGVPLDVLDMDSTLDRLDDFLDARRPHQVATVNLDFIVRAQADPWLRAILKRTALNLIDGTPVVWLLRWLGHPVPERVAGSDLVPRLLGHLARTGRSVYLLGGAPAVAAAAARRMVERNPGLRVAGVDSPRTGSVELIDPGALARIRAASPDVLLVAFGNPKQEYWLDLHLDELDVPLAMGIGGTVDFLAGHRRRAPQWMRRAGLEWTARVLQEPRRLGPRYLKDGLMLARMLPGVLRAGGQHG